MVRDWIYHSLHTDHGDPRKAAALLVLAGALNGLILPLTLLTILLASRNKKIVGEDYKHPTILIVLGVCVVLLTGFSGIKALPGILKMFG